MRNIKSAHLHCCGGYYHKDGPILLCAVINEDHVMTSGIFTSSLPQA
ncbi:hypothetical protein HMPREF9997_01571 [Corynebacterium durum F0235]|uniref:Uncharacterized protein n=1 Tax=Corynebacterium durum F0235 TaxID=1035195 RepID=L1MHG9_9CORY|nr:hypothetical protein HMPREF9997_01571 [Corynebacterium durum F0235]